MAPEDDTLPLMGEADSTEYEDAGDPAVEPDTAPATSDGRDWEESYSHLQGAFSRQGNELGTLRQENDALRKQFGEMQSRQEQQETRYRQRAPEDPDREAILNNLIRNPKAWRDEGTSELRKEVADLRQWRADEQERAKKANEQAYYARVRKFASEQSDFKKYEHDIDGLMRSEGMTVEGAYYKAKALAGHKGEESARKKAKALTRGASIPKGVSASRSAKSTKTAKTFDEAKRMAEADAQGG